MIAEPKVKSTVKRRRKQQLRPAYAAHRTRGPREGQDSYDNPNE